jgi:uncharacterized protein YxjI
MTPFHIEVKTPQGEPVVSVKRGVSVFVSKVQVLDDAAQPIGLFKQKVFSIGGKFDVLDGQEKVLCQLKGNWRGWEFKFTDGQVEYGQISKKWAGLGKELFTSADNYVITISDAVPPDNPLRQLILAAALCIDMVFKE